MLSNEEIRDRIINVTTMILNIEPSQIKNESDFASDLGAESLQSVELVAGFEEEFEIEMDEEEALSVSSVGEAVEYIAKVVADQHD
ncbi:TPA: acyl carrier protein [Candidatus Poribacteria bacterium]|jgi:acyl carrier protein|nr:acyl carrier protein [Candidatus Poribacteria bacterium]HIA70156.1 acyl carrier protein [Candidatus Poribacteria bacterium]HIB89491.1 acyl carrier protein [Candidatus Poribacteria bacterium]HIC01753.1 acyl carrier protein [Candidatus Poribacteria bacterium]HIN28912.1 acyl carrier protein [Candidatus Poribacteria bacterium]